MNNHLLPAEICARLDEYVIGQGRAKRALAIALRNRWRRLMLGEEVAAEITPKNILMIGPTGVGKTELARRLAALADAPFLKVDATRFTEIGYVGRDVEAIIRDLAERAYDMEKARTLLRVRPRAEKSAKKRLLEMLYKKFDSDKESRPELRKKLQDGELDEVEISLDLKTKTTTVGVMGPPGMEEITRQLQSVMTRLHSDDTESRTCTVAAARQKLEDEESEAMIDDDQIINSALKNCEESGVVFIDEIDKVCGDNRSGEVSRHGVQRDLLPLIEGCQVNTRLGTINTNHILFIASGAFHLTRPSDLIPELQGRLPIRVQLEPLSMDDMASILTQPRHSLFQQYQALLSVENVKIEITPPAAKRIAEVAVQINSGTEDIGARRLHTLLEYLLEEFLFDAANCKIVLNMAKVEARLGTLAADTELSRYIL